MLKKCIRLFFCSILTVSVTMTLTACAAPRLTIDSARCNALLLQARMASVLDSKGIQVVRLGEEVTLILPAGKFFNKGSNNLHNTEDLDQIVKFLNAYPTEGIQIKGYTDTVGNYRRNFALSRAQAQAVSSYLFRHGLNTRLISAEGYGCHQAYGFDHLEIFFRMPPPDNVFH
jgi:outer membrane protein OmpA-like peptidoglycan-associated protein